VLLSLKLKDQLVSQTLNLGAQICCFMSLKLMDLIPRHRMNLRAHEKLKFAG
jgi:hypothetical protein